MSCLDKVIVPPSNCTAAEDDSSGCAADGAGGGATLVDYVLIGCGIFLGTLGSVLINLGNNMQALAMHRANSIKAKARWAALADRLPIVGKDGQITSVADAAMAATPLYNDETLATLRRWRRVKAIGTFIFLFGSIVNFVAFAFAAASVLAPLEAVQFITNLVFGKCVHGHKISRKMKIGSVLTAIGTIIAVACGPMSVYEFDIDDLMCFWEDLPWILYAAACRTRSSTCSPGVLHLLLSSQRVAGTWCSRTAPPSASCSTGTSPTGSSSARSCASPLPPPPSPSLLRPPLTPTLGRCAGGPPR